MYVSGWREESNAYQGIRAPSGTTNGPSEAPKVSIRRPAHILRLAHASFLSSLVDGRLNMHSVWLAGLTLADVDFLEYVGIGQASKGQPWPVEPEKGRLIVATIIMRQKYDQKCNINNLPSGLAATSRLKHAQRPLYKLCPSK